MSKKDAKGKGAKDQGKKGKAGTSTESIRKPTSGSGGGG